jgi:hypothetical protein
MISEPSKHGISNDLVAVATRVIVEQSGITPTATGTSGVLLAQLESNKVVIINEQTFFI